MNQVGSHEDLSCTTESALCEESGNTQDLFEIFKCLQIEPERSKEPSPYHEGNFCSEVGRLAGQIRRLYGANRKALNPFHLYLTSVMTDSPIHQECVRRNDGFTNYIVTLEVIDLAKVYVLGGLVDESVQKKLTFQQARANRLQTARLPIQEYMVKTKGSTKNYHSQILSINQVFDVLLTYYETGSWPEALKAGIPSGKGYVFHCTTDLTQNLHRRINA
nr:PREDICTED: tRNA methyltransferase 10 homolog B [Latimeria chalumnae]|eukprot:XP_014353549.1 PREDICTED: tRNA methyltransferase 10 homolog B [Latimeria chalumnae]